MTAEPDATIEPTVMASRTAALVLAAGAASRFGGGKLVAHLDGKPLLQHVLDTVAGAGLANVTVVVGRDEAPLIEQLTWRGERRVRNLSPERGLASSLQVGLDALRADPSVAAALIVLGDQPRLRRAVIDRLLAAAAPGGCPILAPRYAADAAPNPVLLRRPAWSLVDALSGDEGLRSIISARPDLVRRVDVPGDNPDVDTLEDLAALARRADATRDEA